MAIEAVQRSVTARIDNMQHLNYWERIKELGLYSLQRRRERYQIIHLWKIQQNIIPNDLNLQFYKSSRHGVQCRRPKLNTRICRISTLQDNFFCSVGPALYNSIPASIRSIQTLNSFKIKLDTFLKLIPDNPPIPNYFCANKNSIRDWINTGDREAPYHNYLEKTELADISTLAIPTTQELTSFR